METNDELPLLTADIPGTAGELLTDDDFVVEEIPAYLPAGAGEHCFAFIEKRGLTTPQAVERLCQLLGVDVNDVGYAGLKDRHAVTRQWISLHRADLAAVRAVQQPELRVLSAELHGNKLRTGHLAGNRFKIALHHTAPDALAHARVALEVLCRVPGLPNYYGEQRFGAQRDNAARGFEMLRSGRLPKDRFKRRLLLSAAQSQIFNETLAERMRKGTLGTLLGGEVLQKVASGGIFVSESVTDDAPRLLAGEVVITGPMVGPRMALPKPGSPALAVEDAVLARLGVERELFERGGRLSRGARRPLTVTVQEPSVEPLPPDDGIRLSFALPAGSYATVLLREIAKAPVGREPVR